MSQSHDPNSEGTTRWIAITLSSPHAGKEADYNAWYDEVHVPEILATGVVASATRMRAVTRSRSSAPRYAAIYELTTSDIREVSRRLAQASGDAEVFSSLVDPGSVEVVFYEELSRRTP